MSTLRKQQECLARILGVLGKIRYQICEPPTYDKKNRGYELKWFDDIYVYLMPLRTATDCGRFASGLERLADAISTTIGPKRNLGPPSSDADPGILTSVEKDQLLSRIDDNIDATVKKLKKLRPKIGKVKIPEPNVRMGNPTWTWFLGVLSLYPVTWSEWASQLELQEITAALSLVGALLSILYFIELAVVLMIRPMWLYDRKVAGPVIYHAANSKYWYAILAIPLVLFLLQFRVLTLNLSFILLPLGDIGLTLLLGALVALGTIIYIPYSRLRRSMLLNCPWCGIFFKSRDALEQHCVVSYGTGIQDYMKTKDTSKTEENGPSIAAYVVGVGTWGLGIEVISYVKFADLPRFIMLTTLDLFLLIPGVLWILSRRWSKRNEVNQPRREVQRLASYWSGMLLAFTLVVSASIGLVSSAIISQFFNHESAWAFSLYFGGNIGLGLGLTALYFRRRTRVLFHDEEPWRLVWGWKKFLGMVSASFFVYSATAMMAMSVTDMAGLAIVSGAMPSILVAVVWAMDLHQTILTSSRF